MRTNDPVLISLVESLLGEAGIPVFVADAYVSAIEGSIGAFPRRVMVASDWASRARRLLGEAGLDGELRGH